MRDDFGFGRGWSKAVGGQHGAGAFPLPVFSAGNPRLYEKDVIVTFMRSYHPFRLFTLCAERLADSTIRASRASRSAGLAEMSSIE